MTIFERSVLTVDHPEIVQGMTPQHRVRPLMPAAMRGDYAATEPFLALMEDWFPRGVFGKHRIGASKLLPMYSRAKSITTTTRGMPGPYCRAMRNG
jgi:hypothetical protein